MSGDPGLGSTRERFEASLPFGLDDFQSESLDALDAGASVVVAAPTGSGKTVVAEYAIAKALAEGGRVFYTAPIKALSNQKFHDLTDSLGAGRVGLLTGDNSVNDDAPVVVMTTEVLRNMIYARSEALRGLRYVVLDEVHYLQDPYRGPVWEEVIIHTPLEVDLVCLSATVSNAHELADWVTTVRGHTVAVIHETRPIELTHLYLVGDRTSGQVTMIPTFVKGKPNPRGRRYDADADVPGSRRRSTAVTPRRVEVIETLHHEDMLPAIVFVFSRSGCDEAVRSCRQAGLRLTSPHERRDIEDIVHAHVETLTDHDLAALDFEHFLVSLRNGYAAHHAGMVPAFKEAVEACFVEGLVKAVFATETLAVGVNMPARTVVIEKLTKFGGERHALLTPGEFTQLTGRAGRRGIDPVGYAATLWAPFLSFDDVATLASHRTFELRSAFRPTNNMAINLVRRYGRSEAHHLLGLSLAQYQIDAHLVGTRKRADDLRAERLGALDEASCELGDVAEYVRVRDRGMVRPPASDGEIAAALDDLRPGDVLGPVDAEGNLLDVPRNARGGDGWILVLAVAQRRGRGPTLRAVGPNAKLVALTQADFRAKPHVVATVKLPQPFNPNSRSFVSSAAGALQKVMHRSGVRRADVRKAGSAEPGGSAAPRARAARPVDDHPVASCPDLRLHLRALRRVDELTSEIDRLDRITASRSRSLIDQFERVLQLMEQHGYLASWSVTDAGTVLAGIFHESDLLIAECLREGVLDGLTPGQLAGLASVFVYEERGSGALRRRAAPAGGAPNRRRDLEEPGGTARSRNGDLPFGFPKALAPRWWAINRIADGLNRQESELQLPLTRPVDPGFVGLATRWASGTTLEAVLDDAAANGGITGGDFVRTVKSLIDLLRQIGTVAPAMATRDAARAAAESLHRGVVAASVMSAAVAPAPVEHAPDAGDAP